MGKSPFDQKSGLFSIQKAGNIQSIARTFSRNTVTSEEYFGSPIRELFAAARAVIGVASDEFSQAVDGLKALRTTYAREPEKLAVLNAVIQDAELGVRTDEASVVRLREKYRRYLRFGFAQVMLLPESNPGVCYSFVVHWGRRILYGKTHFGMSKQGELNPAPLTLDAVQKARMMNKVDRHILPLQAELKQWGPKQFGTAVMHVGRNDERFAKYGDLMVFPCTSVDQQIDNSARGSEIIGAVRDIARTSRQSIFLVNLARKDRKGGHSIGVHLEGALHFFDPNFGEFDFPNSSERDLDLFLDDWWQFYVDRGPNGPVPHYGFWSLEGISLRNQL
jgi:hypothetical protein